MLLFSWFFGVIVIDYDYWSRQHSLFYITQRHTVTTKNEWSGLKTVIQNEPKKEQKEIHTEGKLTDADL